MSSKKVWEIWVPGRLAMEKISQEIPNLSARFFFNDFCAIWITEPELYDIEILNESNKWIKCSKTRWNRIGKGLYFNHDSTKSIQHGYAIAINSMIGYLKNIPKP